MRPLSDLIALVTDTERFLLSSPETTRREDLARRWAALGLEHAALELFRAAVHPDDTTLQTALSQALYEAAGARFGAIAAASVKADDIAQIDSLFRQATMLLPRDDRLRNLADEAQRALRAAEAAVNLEVDLSRLRLAGAQVEAAIERATTVVVDVGIEAALNGYREALAGCLFDETQHGQVREELRKHPFAELPLWHYLLRMRLRRNIDLVFRREDPGGLRTVLPALLTIRVLTDILQSHARMLFMRRCRSIHLPGVSPAETAFRVRQALAYEAETTSSPEQGWLLYVTGFLVSQSDLEEIGFPREGSVAGRKDAGEQESGEGVEGRSPADFNDSIVMPDQATGG